MAAAKADMSLLVKGFFMQAAAEDGTLQNATHRAQKLTVRSTRVPGLC